LNPLTTVNRREFFRTSGRLALGAAVLGAPAIGRAATGRPKWLVSCRDPLLKASGLSDCWSAMKFLEVDGVEVEINDAMECPSLSWPGKAYSVATDDGVKKLQDDLAAHGRVITGFCMHNRFDERLAQEIDWSRRLVKVCTLLGVTVVRIDVVVRKAKPEEFLSLAVKACQQLCAVANGTPVRFGIENHGKTTNDPEFLDRLFDGVGSPKLGLTMDLLNFYWWGHSLDSLYGIYEKYATRTFHTHCKSVQYPEAQRNVRRPMGWEYGKYSAPIYVGDIDYPRVAGILRKTGYAGDLCLENECLRKFPKEEQPGVLKKEVALLRRVV
jgi:sugar phosphate isomerase/epimerase